MTDQHNRDHSHGMIFAHNCYFRLTVEPVGQRQPMEENIRPIVSDETFDWTAAESIRPSSENRHTLARSGETLESMVGRVWVRVVDVGTS